MEEKEEVPPLEISLSWFSCLLLATITRRGMRRGAVKPWPTEPTEIIANNFDPRF